MSDRTKPPPGYLTHRDMFGTDQPPDEEPEAWVEAGSITVAEAWESLERSAAPLIAAELRAFADRFDGKGESMPNAPWNVAEVLRERANELDPSGTTSGESGA